MNYFERHLKALIAFSLLLFLSFTASAQKITLDISSNKSSLNTGPNEIDISYEMKNVSNEAFVELHFASQIKALRHEMLVGEFKQDILDSDPNGNGIFEPGELWQFNLQHTFEGILAETYALSGAVVGISKKSGVAHTANDATMMYVYGVNMDVEFDTDLECLVPGDVIDITLSTRLLIDEDAAKTPGQTVIIVGDVPITIDLPASQWEARDLLISASYLNDGNEFDPFNPPAGVELENFCDQAGVDAGRNTDNVLDECEPIDTVRDPCEDFGEDDILCEYPDWVFCYSYTIPDDFAQPIFEVVATDNFTVWKSEESPAGSGNFTDFQDISANIETGGSDFDTISVKVGIIPVELSSFEVTKKGSNALLSWTTDSELNNSHFDILRSSDGLNFTRVGRVEGSGSTNERVAYSFLDERPEAGRNYYQLVQYDFDGARDFSSIQQIEFDYAGQGRLTVMPNPASTVLTLSSDEFVGKVKMVLFDKAGKVVFDQNVVQNESISILDIPSGVYLMKLYDSFGIELESKQLIVTK